MYIGRNAQKAAESLLQRKQEELDLSVGKQVASTSESGGSDSGLDIECRTEIPIRHSTPRKVAQNRGPVNRCPVCNIGFGLKSIFVVHVTSCIRAWADEHFEHRDFFYRSLEKRSKIGGKLVTMSGW